MMQQSVENVFARSWELLSKNWIIIVPGVIVGIVVGILTGLFAVGAYSESDPLSAMAHFGARFASGVIVGTIAIAGYIVTQCYTAGMAGAAWMRGTTTLEDGSGALRADAGSVLVAAIGLFVVGVVAALLALPTLGLSVLLFYIFFIYTIASAVVGNHRGLDALGESFRIAKARFFPTLIIAVLLMVIRLLGTFVAAALGWAPFIGPVVAAVINQVVVAYATLVVVGEYLNLRGIPEAPASAQTPPVV
jgi:hypothetical protein